MAIAFTPASDRLSTLLTAKKTGVPGERIAGYSSYLKMESGESISDYYGRKAGLDRSVEQPDGSLVRVPPGPDQTVLRAKVMIGVLVVAALFWATGAIPVGMTALLVGVLILTVATHIPLVGSLLRIVVALVGLGLLTDRARVAWAASQTRAAISPS